MKKFSYVNIDSFPTQTKALLENAKKVGYRLVFRFDDNLFNLLQNKRKCPSIVFCRPIGAFVLYFDSHTFSFTFNQFISNSIPFSKSHDPDLAHFIFDFFNLNYSTLSYLISLKPKKSRNNKHFPLLLNSSRFLSALSLPHNF